ncbi:MAG: hypothetical protein K8R85_02635 [Bacteroidetes bacterium]|nr:hypothetical protein [Bacteroidota bacterium]
MFSKAVIIILCLILTNFADAQSTIKIRKQTISQKKCKANVSIGGITDKGSIKKENLLKEKGIVIKWDESCLDSQKIEVKIRSFEISATINGNTSFLASNNESFTREQIQFLTKLKTGTVLHIEQITVRTPDGIRKREPMYLLID